MVDLNLGCPAKRVVACNGGSGLLRDLPLIAEIFEDGPRRRHHPLHRQVPPRLERQPHRLRRARATRARSPASTPSPSTPAPASRATRGQARWECIAAIKDAVNIPVIGNGDIRTPEDAVAMVAETNCDAVMIGRAAPANPWIFRQIAQYTATGRYDQPTEQDRYRMIRTYFEMLLAEADTSGKEIQGKMKQFASWFTHGVTGGAASPQIHLRMQNRRIHPQRRRALLRTKNQRTKQPRTHPRHKLRIKTTDN